MGIILKLMASPALRAIVAQLLSWLVSEAAAFVAKYLARAASIVQEANGLTESDGTPTPNSEKFRYAADKLKVELKLEGIEAKDHMINAAIEAGVSVIKSKVAK